jgi:nitrogen fixation NifU-like protein
MEMRPLYPKKIMEHFKKPKNMGRMRNPSGVGKVGNLLCGDVLWLYIKVRKDKSGKEIISDVKFECFGCVVAISISSILTTMMKGKTLEEALKLKKEDILKVTGSLPPVKVHCSVLATDALHEAVYDYYSRNNLPIPQDLKKEHERIKRTLKKVEERFKKYVEFQQKVMKIRS